MKKVSCTVLALAVILLFSALPAAAGCGETCWPSGQCDNPASWETGCYMSGSACLDLPNCWGFAATERNQILEAAQAGDYQKVAKLAKKAGSLLRVTVKTEKGVIAVYDGWALAGLPGPDADGNAVQLASNQGACDITVTAPATEKAPESATVEATATPQER